MYEWLEIFIIFNPENEGEKWVLDQMGNLKSEVRIVACQPFPSGIFHAYGRQVGNLLFVFGMASPARETLLSPPK